MDPDLTCLFPLFTPLWNPRDAFKNDFRFEKAPAKWKWQSRQRNTRKHTHHKNTNTHTAKPLNEKKLPQKQLHTPINVGKDKNRVSFVNINQFKNYQGVSF